MNILNNSLFLILLTHTVLSHTKMVEFTENPFQVQAPQEIAEIVEKAVNKYNFLQDFEVIVPTKAGLLQYPHFHISETGINPYTKNFFINVNPQWFLNLPVEQQDYFLAYSFITDEYGSLPNSLQYLGLLFIALSFLVAIALSFSIRKTLLKNMASQYQTLWIIIFLVVLKWLFWTPLENKTQEYLTKQHKIKLHSLAIQKAGNKNAAVNYLRAVDTFIREQANNGEVYFQNLIPLLKTELFIDEINKL